MSEIDRRSNKELATTDIFALNDQALKQHINALQDERNRLKDSVVPSVGECNTLITLCHADLSARSTDRLAKRAIYISVIAIIISAIASAI